MRVNTYIKDIATFEHYKSSWDEIIFDIIDKGETSIFEIQDYFEFVEKS